jgi:pimeloyl-[acyl-carrier protein] synthase
MSRSAFYFNPFDPEFRANPYPHFPMLLDGAPRQIDLFMPATVVARYADVAAVLRDHERFSARRPEILTRARIDPFDGAPTILTADPPVHTRLRRLVSKAFTPSRVRELEGRIRDITNDLLDRSAREKELEAMAEFANPLPVIVIAELLGVSPSDHERFKQWSNDLIGSFGRDLATGPSAEGIAAKEALRNYLARAIDERRAKPTDDLVGALVTARDENDALTEDELLAFVVLLLLGGNETSTNLIGNGLLALARHPEQQQRLRQDPGLLPKAVEEMLRYDPPVQMTVRTSIGATEVGGTEIPPNSLLFVLIAAANRDPAKFPNPEVFDTARDPNEHLSFGGGVHFCLGAPLTRLEGAIAIESVLNRYSRLSLADSEEKLEYRGSLALRGLSTLRLSVG